MQGDSTDSDPHGLVPAVRVGPPLSAASGLLILIHGRGADPNDILSLLPFLGAESLHVAALGAAGHSWYPNSFLAPVERNEPGRSSGLATIDRHVSEATEVGMPTHKMIIGGFSQGACLSLEYAHTRRRRYGAILGFSGGLIGPPGTDFDGPDMLDGTPVFLGCSDRDPHIPKERVHETAVALESGGAIVDERIYPAMGHTVNADELGAAWDLVQAVAGE